MQAGWWQTGSVVYIHCAAQHGRGANGRQSCDKAIVTASFPMVSLFCALFQKGGWSFDDLTQLMA